MGPIDPGILEEYFKALADLNAWIPDLIRLAGRPATYIEYIGFMAALAVVANPVANGGVMNTSVVS